MNNQRDSKVYKEHLTLKGENKLIKNNLPKKKIVKNIMTNFLRRLALEVTNNNYLIRLNCTECVELDKEMKMTTKTDKRYWTKSFKQLNR